MRRQQAAAGVILHANDPCWCGSGKKFKRCHRQLPDALHGATVSPPRTVPEGIELPDYATNGGKPSPKDPDMVRPSSVIAAMRETCRLAAEVLAEAGASVGPGVTTDAIDAIVHEACVSRGAYPSPLGYSGFPKSVCTSVNEVICHGIPDSRPLEGGDIVNLDVTLYFRGVHGDTNATFLVGDVDEASKSLVRVTRECLQRGIEAVAPGRPIFEIGRAIESHATSNGYGVVRAFVGHGVARTFHCPPSVPHYYDPRATTIMEPGMTFTIEPMITMGDWRHVMWDDGWTAVTADRRRTAQFEHTLLVTDDGVEVLTEA